MKVYLSALGCKLNEGELEAWTRKFAAEGNEIVQDARHADLCVINTCTVTRVAARKSRGLARRVAAANKNAKIILTGCYATMAPQEAISLPNVAMVVPNSDKDELVALAGRLYGDAGFQISQNGCRMPEAVSGALIDGFHARAPHQRTRAFVKIEDGCNMSCSYCIIPLARGRARSRIQSEIVAEIAGLVDDGYREVILTGVQISDYRLEERAAGKARLRGLCTLISAVLRDTSLPRLRLTSIAPWDLEEELLDLFADARLCRHLHLSLQSGSRTVLSRMRRPYSPQQFAEAVALARSGVPDVGITTDVIVGFPGESDVEFLESLDLVKRMEFARVHVFPFSPREGTYAAGMPLQVKEEIKEARAKAMQRVADESAKAFAGRFLGRTLPVLFESSSGEQGLWTGYSDNYIRVQASGAGQDLTNRILNTRIESVGEEGAEGSLKDASGPNEREWLQNA